MRQRGDRIPGQTALFFVLPAGAPAQRVRGVLEEAKATLLAAPRHCALAEPTRRRVLVAVRAHVRGPVDARSRDARRWTAKCAPTTVSLPEPTDAGRPDG